MRIFSSPAWRVLLAGAALPCAIQLAGTGAAAVAAAHGPGPRAPVPTRLNTGHRAAPLPAGEQAVCPAPARPGQMQCMSIIRTNARGQAAGPTVTIRGYGPSALRSAYKIASAAASGGRGRTIAIVDAFSDPRAGSDLAAYRAHYHLGACTKANGCLRIVNEHGKAGPLPGANRNWAGEESLDLDMVSAICPKCHIMLVEASSASVSDLAIAEGTAVAKGARYVSNSWSGGEFVGQDVFNHFFNHPGVAIDFASGDFGYGPAYPADLQYVTAVGGTTLRHSRTGRGWTEAVWGSATPARRGGDRFWLLRPGGQALLAAGGRDRAGRLPEPDRERRRRGRRPQHRRRRLRHLPDQRQLARVRRHQRGHPDHHGGLRAGRDADRWQLSGRVSLPARRATLQRRLGVEWHLRDRPATSRPAG